jgi:multidrug efflux pump subunit AcrA (membrane-fusion protein)
VNKKVFITIAIVLLIGLFGTLIILNLLSGRSQTSAPQGNPASQGGPAGAPAGGVPRGGAGGGPSSRNAIAVRVVTVAPDVIERSVIINGEILARNQITIYPTVGGRLVEYDYAIGDRVNRGDVVAMVDPSRPGEVFSRSPVISTVAGTVLQTSYHVGDTVTTQSGVLIVGDLSSLLVETNVPERFVASVRQGLRAALWFEAFAGEIFAAEIYEISPVLDPATRTLRIRLRFINQDPRIRAGMFATVSLVTEQKTEIPVIPRLSVINTYGSWIVFIVDENNIARRREVTLGIENEEFVEIIDGISMGDRVVIAGQNFLTDGDSVRIVE